MNRYVENGYENRKDYLENIAEEYGVDYETVMVIANILGPDEDFDGLISNLSELDGEDFF